MIKLVCGLLFIAIIGAANGQNFRSLPKFVDGSPLIEQRSFAGILPANTEPLTCPTGSRGSVCAPDCSTLLTCSINKPTPLDSSACSSISPEKPYCLPGTSTCSATGNETNPECKLKSDFECTDIGYFPDPKNCSRYVYCGDSGEAEPYYCPYYYVYDSINTKCKLYTRSSDCGTVSCAAYKNTAIYAAYPLHPAFYGLCLSTSDIIMLRCADIENFAFNIATGSCEFKCKADGQYPDFESCTGYYECYRYGSTYYNNKRKCPTGTFFDVTKRSCVRGTCPTTLAPETTPTSAATDAPVVP